MATVVRGSSPPSRSYQDAIAGAALRPPPSPVSFDTVSFRPMGMPTRDQGMKNLRRWMLAQGFCGDFSVGVINVRHVYIKFALEEDYMKLWIKSICIAHLSGTPLETDVSMATLVRPSVAWVCIEINFLEPLQTEIGLDFGTKVIIQSVIYERLPKYYGTCKHLGYTEDECYEKFKTRALVRLIERDDQRASDHVDIRVKLDAQRAQRELNTRRKSKRVVFEDVDGCPGATSSGAKGTEDGGVEVELHDTVLPDGMPEIMLHGETVDGGPDKDGSPGGCVGQAGSCAVPMILEADPRVEQPVCVENLIPDTEDAVLCQSGEDIIQTDTEDVARRMAHHRRVGRWVMSLRLIQFHQTVERWCYRPVGLSQEAIYGEAAGFSGCVIKLWELYLVLLGTGCECDTVERRALWDDLLAVSVGASPWIVGGDFNTILSPDERSGGSAPSSIAMSDFHDAIADSALVDVVYVGSPYTWYSRRLCRRLDRVLVSSCWYSILPKMQITHLELSQSDHRGLLVEAEFIVERKSATEGDDAYDHDPCGRTLVEQNRFPAELVQKRRFPGAIFGIQYDGEYLIDSFAIKNSAVSFFQRLLTAELVFLEEMDSEILEDGLTD
ncbi:UNVERIFIED_CONTAM: hypothetical protein Sangu_0840400 [Sesamum angustifolium]|uniref:Endonuclease/exonuclease/phosphatase domain-containing protein n=1 Tax=Sesamum angustifolium TaxID=2727405 RepID=A0AAW2PWY9_9LAMI